MINRIIRLFDQNKIFDVEELPDYKVVGMDLFGGTFLLNIDGKIDYFAPDTLEFENLGLNYNEFVHWTKNGDIEGFYESLFWDGWEAYAEQADESQGISIYPPMWSNEYNAESASRRIVPLKELFGVNLEYRKKFML